MDPSNRETASFGSRIHFRREIALVLLIKLVLLIAIKQVFFSHPINKQEAAVRLSAMIDGGNTALASPVSTRNIDTKRSKHD